jgi:hypothetical protein
LGGLLILLTSNLASGAPKLFAGLLVLFVVVSGLSLAQARVTFQLAATKLERTISVGDTALPLDHRWPTSGEVARYLGLFFGVLAGVCYLVAVWWVVLSSGHARSGFDLTVATPSINRRDRTVSLPVTCSQQCHAVGMLAVSPSVALQLHLPTPTVGFADSTLASGDHASLTIRLTSATFKRLIALHDTRLRVQVWAGGPPDSAQTRSSTLILEP